MSGAASWLQKEAFIGQEAAEQEALRLELTGQLQGVGFRPYVYRLARELGLKGSVRNVTSGARIEVSGAPAPIREFIRRLPREVPPLARIDSIRQSRAPQQQPKAFEIAKSDGSPDRRGRVTVDSGVCNACLAEMEDPANRRHAHGLINCTDCGPRYSIVQDLPYDRPNTTMAGFKMCPRCAAEYKDPADRRFHAQPVCCPDCGPEVTFVQTGGRESPAPLMPGDSPAPSTPGDSPEEDPYTAAAHLLKLGGILAMKGLGGYHLVVDATNEDAVQRLRARKRRQHKPLAIMAQNIRKANRLVTLTPLSWALLSSPASPIVIGPCRRPGSDVLAPSLAPGQDRLGIMLPNTPMQHLLAEAYPHPLVMTSANLSDDPLIKDDDAAIERLAGIADGFLTHNRPIERAIDDSVFLDSEPGPLPVRRARGLVPEPTPLHPAAVRPGLCMGADLKNTVALVRDKEAVLSQHVGDLSHTLALTRCHKTIDDLCRLLRVTPEWIAVDAHPRYLSRRAGERLAAERALPLVEVQHHHAHLASLLAEHGRTDRIVGLVCDGVGYGRDGTAWGGEVLVGDLLDFERVAHLRPMRLPGGDAAAQATGRCAVSWMVDALGLEEAGKHPVLSEVLPYAGVRKIVLGMLAKDLNCPPSTGMGRLFDAAAALIGLCDFNHFEAMSGQLLEAAANRSVNRPTTQNLLPLADREIDTRPLLLELLRRKAQGQSPEDLAWHFHSAVADALVRAALKAAASRGIHTVGLTGGVFCNTLLTALVRSALLENGLEVLTHRIVPPNDGGIALGQAAVAAARFHNTEN